MYVFNEICDVDGITKDKVGMNIVSIQKQELSFFFVFAVCQMAPPVFQNFAYVKFSQIEQKTSGRLN
jgi:hypothetical protein